MSTQTPEESRSNGRWSKEEHEKFMLGLQLYGKDWKKIEALIGTRNGAQIRSHAQKFFIKVKKETEHSDLNDHWEQTKESPLEHISSPLAITHDQTKTEYSYYLNKIVQRDALRESFDFWASLIDHKPLQDFQAECTHPKKNSFVSIGSEKCGLELAALRKNEQL